MSIYSYRCQTCREVTEEYHSMSNFPRETVCFDDQCAGKATLVILHAPHFSVDRMSEEFNDGAGVHFRNKAHKKEWLRQSAEVYQDPRNGEEVESGWREMMPEESAVEYSYIKDLKEARKDKAPDPVHPNAVRKEKLAKDRLQKTIDAARPRALAFAGGG